MSKKKTTNESLKFQINKRIQILYRELDGIVNREREGFHEKMTAKIGACFKNRNGNRFYKMVGYEVNNSPGYIFLTVNRFEPIAVGPRFDFTYRLRSKVNDSITTDTFYIANQELIDLLDNEITNEEFEAELNGVVELLKNIQLIPPRESNAGDNQAERELLVIGEEV